MKMSYIEKEDIVSVENHISALKTKKQEIEKKIEREENRAAVDELKIQVLKKEKLRIKDEIADMGGL